MKIVKSTLSKWERYFFRAQKGEDKAAYIKLKYQFRIMLTVSLLIVLMGVWLLVFYGRFLPMSIPMLASVLVGFRFKFYNLPRTVIFAAMTIIPIKYMGNDMFFAVPASILFMNIQILAQTQSAILMLIHLTIQTSALYFFGMERIIKIIQGMTPEEIASIARANFYFCIFGAWINLVTMQRFYAHVSNLLRKVSVLWENISKVNKQLNDQNSKLQNHLEMKDVFIYTFSHELKNALNGLLGNLYLAYDIAKEPQLVEFLTSAKVCGEVLKNFVHNILDSGKLENGNLEVASERRDVMSFMENVWQICGRIIENKRLQGYLEIAKNVPRYLDLDEQRMIQIILNLVSNACKFTEKGHVRIQVSWQRIPTSDEQSKEGRASFAENKNRSEEVVQKEEEGESNFYENMKEFRDTSESCLLDREKLHLSTGRQKKFIYDSQFYQLTLSKWNWNREEVLPSNSKKETKGILKIQVWDTGCGMTEEDQALLFQKFSQTNKIAGQRKVGTGLGLWICRELSKRLDGDIKASSKVGVGSVFELTICTTVSIFEDKPQMFASTSIDYDTPLRKLRRSPHTQNSKKILLADDDNFNVELMKNYLNKFGICYLCAYDGEEAVSLFKKHYEDICFVITDNFMPKKTGVEAALEIKSFLKAMKKPSIPIMCISGDVKVHVGEAGITSVIQKPINFDRLKEELMIIYPQLSRDQINTTKPIF